jgi:hypothetical protein
MRCRSPARLPYAVDAWAPSVRQQYAPSLFACQQAVSGNGGQDLSDLEKEMLMKSHAFRYSVLTAVRSPAPLALHDAGQDVKASAFFCQSPGCARKLSGYKDWSEWQRWGEDEEEGDEEEEETDSGAGKPPAAPAEPA